MDHPNNARKAFCHENQYKIGAVTYEVAAFFDEAGEDARAKLERLLKTEVQHSQSVGIIAGSQVGTVK